MESLEAMERETSDRGTAGSFAGPSESLEEPHAAIEAAILGRRPLNIPISSGFVSPCIGKHTSRHGTANRVDAMGASAFACGQLDLSHRPFL